MTRGHEPVDRLLERAHEMHVGGYNCSETVLWALAEYWKMNCSVSYATGLGGGIARTGETCGALTGAIVALGARIGRTEPGDEHGKLTCYRQGQEVAKAFKERMRTTQCRDIIGFVLASEGGSRKYAAEGFKGGTCKDAIEIAIRAAIQVVDAESA